jgi:hypothetical protein
MPTTIPEGWSEEDFQRFVRYTIRVQEWMREKWGSSTPECPMCHTTEWRIFPAVDAPIRAADFSPRFQGQAFPLVPIMCANCTNMVFISSRIPGFESRTSTEAAAPESKADAK